MVEIISVRFKEGGKHYYFNPNGAQFQPGEGVIVETTRAPSSASASRGTPPLTRWSSPPPCARCSAGPPRRTC